MDYSSFSKEELIRQLKRFKLGEGQAINRHRWFMRSLNCCELLIGQDGSIILARYHEPLFGKRSSATNVADLFGNQEGQEYFKLLNLQLSEYQRASEKRHSEWSIAFDSTQTPLSPWPQFPAHSWKFEDNDHRVRSLFKGDQFLTSPFELINAGSDFRITYTGTSQDARELTLIMGRRYKQGSSTLTVRRPEDDGYAFAFGAFGNSCTGLQRQHFFVSESPERITQGKNHHFIAERIGSRFRFLVDKELILDYIDPIPLGGPGRGFVTLYTCSPQTTFTDLKIWTKPALHIKGAHARIEQLRSTILKIEGTQPKFASIQLLKINSPSKGQPSYQIHLMDVTERVSSHLRAETSQQEKVASERARSQLEQMVRKRTTTLQQTNDALQGEVMERKRLQDQLVQSQRMEAVGRLAGGIAHDFNNMLTVILGRCHLLLFNKNGKKNIEPDVKDIQLAADRAALLTRQLLAFSRKQILLPTLINVNKISEDILNILKKLAGEHIKIETRFSDNVNLVLIDAHQLEQVLVNLISNARDAMPKGGHIFIKTENIELNQDNIHELGVAHTGSFVRLSVTDTGCGMDEPTRKQAFEPFFTTKEIGKGTGLGLSSVYGTLRQSLGQVSIESKKNKGTTVHLYLPKHSEIHSDSDNIKRPDSSIEEGSETILVVEDEPAVLELVQQILLDDGYRVLTASNALNALEKYSHDTTPIHLLLTDVVMPGMNGKILSEKLHAARPDIKTLFMSGHTDSAILNQGIMNQDERFLQKPFSRKALLKAIRQALDVAVQKKS